MIRRAAGGVTDLEKRGAASGSTRADLSRGPS